MSSFVRFQKKSRTTVWSAIPSVAVPPSRAIMGGVHSAIRVCGPPNTTRKIAKPAMETRLFTVGAQL